MAGDDALMMDVRKLRLFNQMAKAGAATVADHLSQMTGLQAQMDITRINFLDIDDVERHLGRDRQVGVTIELVEPPHGYVLILFDQRSAKQLTNVMMGGDPNAAVDSGEFTDMERSAVQEIGNIMTSGFIDGWANVLNTTIDISTPRFIDYPGTELASELTGGNDEMALVFDSHIHAPEADIDAKVYTFPVLAELVALMNRITLK